MREETAFNRTLVKQVHAVVKAAFPAIPNIWRACTITKSSRDQYFAEVEVPGFPLEGQDVRAASFFEARFEAWNKWLAVHASKLPDALTQTESEALAIVRAMIEAEDSDDSSEVYADRWAGIFGRARDLLAKVDA